MTGDFTSILRGLSDAAGLPLTGEQLDKLSAFYSMLEEANRSFNLTSIEGPREAAERHFIDSLALPAMNLLPSGSRVIDVGTGAGFPGLPIAIVREGLNVTLLDSMKKRTAFLETAVRSLSLSNVAVVTARAEDHARGPARETFDAVLSRAVAPLNVLLEYTLPFVRSGGVSLAWKGPSAPEEIRAGAKACRVLGGGNMTAHGYSLSGREFCIVETGKTRPTPKNFPRKAGKPSAEPIV